MIEIRKWLESIGLAQYADAFDGNDIDMDLPSRLGHRCSRCPDQPNEQGRGFP
jgi:hypothetical protein